MLTDQYLVGKYAGNEDGAHDFIYLEKRVIHRAHIAPSRDAVFVYKGCGNPEQSDPVRHPERGG